MENIPRFVYKILSMANYLILKTKCTESVLITQLSSELVAWYIVEQCLTHLEYIASYVIVIYFKVARFKKRNYTTLNLSSSSQLGV